MDELKKKLEDDLKELYKKRDELSMKYHQNEGAIVKTEEILKTFSAPVNPPPDKELPEKP